MLHRAAKVQPRSAIRLDCTGTGAPGWRSAAISGLFPAVSVICEQVPRRRARAGDAAEAERLGHRRVDQLATGHEDRPVGQTTLWLVLAALGDSLLGGSMAQALGLSRDAARELATRHLLADHKYGREQA